MRIEQQACRLNDLVSQAVEGAVVPAAFQRPYVWSQADVLALLESILRGYPVGTFLLWTPYGKADLTQAARQRLGPIAPNSASNGTSMLLDGQNRLASLAWVMRDPETELPPDLTEHERLVWCSGEELVVDLERQKFEFVPNVRAAEGLRLPMYALFDSRLANPLIRRRWDGGWAKYSEGDREAALRWFDKAQNAFSDARTVVVDMQNATVDEARDAFLHICKVGVPMSEADFQAAVSWMTGPKE